MKNNGMKKAVITGIATCVGVFGGAKLYLNKKKEKAAAKEEQRKKELGE